jgi:hypothetical protein
VKQKTLPPQTGWGRLPEKGKENPTNPLKKPKKKREKKKRKLVKSYKSVVARNHSPQNPGGTYPPGKNKGREKKDENDRAQGIS